MGTKTTEICPPKPNPGAWKSGDKTVAPPKPSIGGGKGDATSPPKPKLG